MALRVLAFAVAGVIEHRRRRAVAAEWPIVAHINLNPAVDVETATGFAAPYNWGEQLKPVRGAAAGRAGGPSGSV
jgi:hypothetical protein